MLIPRVIPVLLLKGEGLVKTTAFKDPKYVGDPINAVRIFNEKEVDELIFLDITAAKENRGPNLEMVKRIASECFMPLGYGGGVRSVEQAGALFAIGVEKVIINSGALDDLSLITEVSNRFGAQAVVGAVDVRKPLLSGPKVYDHRTGSTTGLDPVEQARRLADAGAGEVFVNSVDRDGTRTGYMVDMVRAVADAVAVPVIASGGADSLTDVRRAVVDGHASAAAAGAMFVYHGRHRAVLITYPTQQEIAASLC